MQSLRDKMRGISTLLKELGTDPEVVAIRCVGINVATAITTDIHRPEQLNLPTDLAFNMDLDLGFDLSSFDTTFSSSEPSSLLSPRTLASTQTSFLEDEQMLEPRPPLELSSSHDAGEGFGFDAGEEFGFDALQPASGAAGQQPMSKVAGELAIGEQPSVIEEAAFEVDEEGNVTFRDEEDRPPAIDQSASNGLMGEYQDIFELNFDADHTEARDTVSLAHNEEVRG